jgi:hypothetical protein|tara:strand:- start:38 stop:265 length:228 start_codon:yes stop_codon:yes gene_type:complete
MTFKGAMKMKTWEMETPQGDHVRLSWNESATFNLQTGIGGQWVDYHCFTVYGIDSALEALSVGYDAMIELEGETT